MCPNPHRHLGSLQDMFPPQQLQKHTCKSKIWLSRYPLQGDKPNMCTSKHAVYLVLFITHSGIQCSIHANTFTKHSQCLMEQRLSLFLSGTQMRQGKGVSGVKGDSGHRQKESNPRCKQIARQSSCLWVCDLEY